jgi:hypothetical protein
VSGRHWKELRQSRAGLHPPTESASAPPPLWLVSALFKLFRVSGVPRSELLPDSREYVQSVLQVATTCMGPLRESKRYPDGHETNTASPCRGALCALVLLHCSTEV